MKILITQSRGGAEVLCRPIRRGGRFHSCEGAETDAPYSRQCYGFYYGYICLPDTINKIMLCMVKKNPRQYLILPGIRYVSTRGLFCYRYFFAVYDIYSFGKRIDVVSAIYAHEIIYA